jgi:hypothetical protein
MMSAESRKMAGVLLLLLPAVMIGGVSILTLLVGTGVVLLLSLIALRYVDQAMLSAGVVTLRVGLLRTPLRVACSI